MDFMDFMENVDNLEYFGYNLSRIWFLWILWILKSWPERCSVQVQQVSFLGVLDSSSRVLAFIVACGFLVVKLSKRYPFWRFRHG